MIDNEKICSCLNDLLEINYDAQSGFANAAEGSDNARLSTFFENKANQRSNFIREIKDEIIRLGGTPSEFGSALGFMHRAWMDIKTAFTTNDEEAILEACEIGEKAALEKYDEFLNNKDCLVSTPTRSMIERQRNAIAISHGKVKNLEDRFDN